MDEKIAEPLGGLPLSPALTLRDACRRTGQDDDGRRCPACPMRDLCESEERWLAQLISRSVRN